MLLSPPRSLLFFDRPSARPASAGHLRAAAFALGTVLLASVAPTSVLAQPAATPPSSAPTSLAPFVITATRTAQPPEHVPFSLKTIEGETLRAIPSATLDGALRSIPGFSLFRRSDSLTANPTAQGLSLRGLGPSGASRSLIVLDGVPLNDPFGGWISWTLIPRDSLARAEILRGGGATAWGNAALGGVVQLVTQTTGHWPPALTASFGDFDTRSAELNAGVPIAGGSVEISGRAFSTDGFKLVAPERRGPIDVDAASRHSWLSGRWRHPLTANVELTLTARTFQEKRNNGTPFQRNASRSTFGSLALAAQPDRHFGWTAVAYAQDQGFSSTFSGVNATRTAETPASDQFAVPATAYGGAWTSAWQHADGARTSAGLDARRVQGETRERFTFVSGAFTRLRIAGGNQEVAGLFALHERPIAPTVRFLVGGRLDRWTETNGHRRESDLATGVASRDERYADRDGVEFSPSAGLVWTAAPGWRVRAAAQQAFRRPTLNELYRPFRVGANITETNPALRTERVTTAELGVEWSSAGVPPASVNAPGLSAARVPPAHRFTLGAAVFWNDLRDAVGNVTVARGPGTFPLFGFIAANGVGRQRLNLDRTRVRGLELSANYQATPTLNLSADFLYNDAVVRRATVAPALVGKRLAQVPRQSATLGFAWRLPANTTLAPRLRWLGRQFEDDENALRLGEVAIVDLGLRAKLGRATELFLNMENVGNTRVETGRSADGVVNVGTPRFLFGGLRYGW